jgi:PleD family two-component response regulator
VVTFSVGVAVLPPGGNPDVALKAADESMYRAKEKRVAERRPSVVA